jgi:hypothetical protein
MDFFLNINSMDKASKYAIATLMATSANIGVAAIAGTYTAANALDCTGNPHDLFHSGNPHDNRENGNPHDVNNLEPLDEAAPFTCTPGSK